MCLRLDRKGFVSELCHIPPETPGIRRVSSNITRRVDFALFMVAAIENDELVHEAPAIVGCKTPSALAHAAGT